MDLQSYMPQASTKSVARIASTPVRLRSSMPNVSTKSVTKGAGHLRSHLPNISTKSVTMIITDPLEPHAEDLPEIRGKGHQ